jgi:CubicO group peptidase (beta-lactamase class C family)
MPDKFTQRQWFVAVLAILALAQSVQPQATKADIGFEKQLPEWMKEANVPAVGIGIIEDGKLKYTKVFGELRNGVPGKQLSPENTIFQIASLTKPVVEVLTLMLVTKGECGSSMNHWPTTGSIPRCRTILVTRNSPRDMS